MARAGAPRKRFRASRGRGATDPMREPIATMPCVSPKAQWPNGASPRRIGEGGCVKGGLSTLGCNIYTIYVVIKIPWIETHP